MPTRLERSATNRVIAGVCGGIAEYLQVDATLVRVFFVIGGLLTAGFLLLGYIVLLILMPLPGEPLPLVQSGPAGDASGTGSSASTASAPRPSAPIDPAAAERRRAIFGYFLVALGVVFLLQNLGAFRLVRFDLIWPLVLIALGALLLAERIRRR